MTYKPDNGSFVVTTKEEIVKYKGANGTEIEGKFKAEAKFNYQVDSDARICKLTLVGVRSHYSNMKCFNTKVEVDVSALSDESDKSGITTTIGSCGVDHESGDTPVLHDGWIPEQTDYKSVSKSWSFEFAANGDFPIDFKLHVIATALVGSSNNPVSKGWRNRTDSDINKDVPNLNNVSLGFTLTKTKETVNEDGKVIIGIQATTSAGNSCKEWKVIIDNGEPQIFGGGNKLVEEFETVYGKPVVEVIGIHSTSGVSAKQSVTFDCSKPVIVEQKFIPIATNKVKATVVTDVPCHFRLCSEDGKIDTYWANNTSVQGDSKVEHELTVANNCKCKYKLEVRRADNISFVASIDYFTIDTSETSITIESLLFYPKGLKVKVSAIHAGAWYYSVVANTEDVISANTVDAQYIDGNTASFTVPMSKINIDTFQLKLRHVRNGTSIGTIVYSKKLKKPYPVYIKDEKDNIPSIPYVYDGTKGEWVMAIPYVYDSEAIKYDKNKWKRCKYYKESGS